MRIRHAAMMAGLALGLMSSAAHAAPIIFNYTGGFQTFTAQTTGVYNITSYGAQGGAAYGSTLLGGLGAEVGGDFTLTQGQQLTILVGGLGGKGGDDPEQFVTPQGGGGGGGSFVYTPIQGTFQLLPYPQMGAAPTFTGYVQLADAAGGGGRGTVFSSFAPGGDGQGGEGPNPGGPTFQSSEVGGDGAGYLYQGANGGGGFAPAAGGQGGADPFYVAINASSDVGQGGFGGGGGAGGGEYAGGALGGGGGGGGYTGGIGGGGARGGSGGYSYLAAGTPMNADYVALSGVREGNGLVTIDLVSGVSPVPLPASAPMFGAALLALGAVSYGMKRKKAASAA